MGTVGTVNDKLKDVVRNWLNIQPSSGNSITIQETNTFEGSCFRNLLWYRGDASELHQYYTQLDDMVGNAKFWAAESTNGIDFRKIHTGLPAMIIDMLADVIVDSFNKISINNNDQAQKDWEEIEKDNDFKEIIKQAIIDVFIENDGAFKISYDTEISKYPIIEFYPGSKVEFEYTRGRITAIIFKNYYNKKDNTYLLKERYDKNGITYKLYNSDKECNLSELEETKDLKTITDNGFMMAFPMMFNKSKKFKRKRTKHYRKKIRCF